MPKIVTTLRYDINALPFIVTSVYKFYTKLTMVSPYIGFDG